MAALTSLARSIREPPAFDAFYVEHAERLLRFFARRTLDGEAAADLTAETFTQAYRSRPKFRGRSDEEAAGWLYAIAYRQLALFRHRGAVDRVTLERLGIATPQLVDADYERIEQLLIFPRFATSSHECWVCSPPALRSPSACEWSTSWPTARSRRAST